MWVKFMDMHSGGGLKEYPFKDIFIEAASEEEAKLIFYNHFLHDPTRVTCGCCGDDYSIFSAESLAELTAYDRNCKHLIPIEYKDYLDKHNRSFYLDDADQDNIPEGYQVNPYNYYVNLSYIRLEDYLKQTDILVLHKEDIKDEEKKDRFFFL